MEIADANIILRYLLKIIKAYQKKITIYLKSLLPAKKSGKLKTWLRARPPLGTCLHQRERSLYQRGNERGIEAVGLIEKKNI